MVAKTAPIEMSSPGTAAWCSSEPRFTTRDSRAAVPQRGIPSQRMTRRMIIRRLVSGRRCAGCWKGESKRDGEPWAVWVPSGSGVHLTALRASPRAGCCPTSRSATTRRSARLRWSRPASPPSPGKRHRDSADASGPWPKERLVAADLRRHLSLEFAPKEECGAKQAAVDPD